MRLASHVLKKGLICIGLAFLAFWIRASDVTPFTIEQLAAQSQLIVQGKVLSKTCQRDAQARIYTSIDFEVTDVWKGVLKTNRLTVVQGGGVLGERAVIVSGQADYVIGEEAVCFLVLNPKGEAVSLSLSQGKFSIGQNPATGEKYAWSAHVGSRPSTNTARQLTFGTTPPALTLQALKQQATAPTP